MPMKCRAHRTGCVSFLFDSLFFFDASSRMAGDKRLLVQLPEGSVSTFSPLRWTQDCIEYQMCLHFNLSEFVCVLKFSELAIVRNGRQYIKIRKAWEKKNVEQKKQFRWYLCQICHQPKGSWCARHPCVCVCVREANAHNCNTTIMEMFTDSHRYRDNVRNLYAFQAHSVSSSLVAARFHIN